MATGVSRTTHADDRTLLLQYRVLAFTTAVLLIVLVFAGIPLQFAAGRPQVVNMVGTLHGVLYVVYLGTAFRLTRRLGVPRWQMALVLLAGTVPFCAFVAERKMTARYNSLGAPPEARRHPGDTAPAPVHGSGTFRRRRWLSRRALVLHAEVLLVAPACVLAGWWQATRALAGNGLSWVYSVEWPIFAIIALLGWWQLVHEDPEAYRRRKARHSDEEEHAAIVGGVSLPDSVADARTARRASALAGAVGVVFVLGIMSITVVALDRPAGIVPHKGAVIELVHAAFGFGVVVGAMWFVAASAAGARSARIVSWMGLCGLAVAGIGGMLTWGGSGLRVFGMALMFIGPAFSGPIYLVPHLSRSSARKRAAKEGSAPAI